MGSRKTTAPARPLYEITDETEPPMLIVRDRRLARTLRDHGLLYIDGADDEALFQLRRQIRCVWCDELTTYDLYPLEVIGLIRSLI